MPDPAPSTSSIPSVALADASRFVAASGFVVDEVSGHGLTGHVDLGADHLTPWGVVHGGVYATIIESAASVAASAAVVDRGQFAVGVNNSTDFLRSTTGCRAAVAAEPLQQGRTQQLWLVVITDTGSGKVLARGQVRLQNVPLPG